MNTEELLQRVKKSDLKYSEQAIALLCLIQPDLFKVDEFEAWFEERIIAGSSHVIEFVQEKQLQKVRQLQDNHKAS